jgi:predicted short-subunit dehydrogenase-like oxidoreductase (DUF2520 family)
MKITLIGAGNLATNLGKALLAAGHDIQQVFSRTMESAEVLAEKLGGAPTTDLNSINGNADVYIVAVKDSVLTDVIPSICRGKENKMFIHTAGSMPLDVFYGMAHNYGVLYPMQSFSKSKDVNFKDIPCFIEGNDEYSIKMLQNLAKTITDKTYYLSTEDRRYLHLAAVFACNFTNHCYAISSEILQKHKIPFDVMIPLIDETANKVHTLSPIEAQTGPAVRYDQNVIRAQSSLLKDNPIIKDIYERMSLSINSSCSKNVK